MTEFIGLRAKLYSYSMDDETEIKKCKGIKKSVIANNLKFENFKNTLFNQKEQRVEMNVIRSYKHNIFSETVNKIALSADDDKRIILKDKISIHALFFKQ